MASSAAAAKIVLGAWRSGLYGSFELERGGMAGAIARRSDGLSEIDVRARRAKADLKSRTRSSKGASRAGRRATMTKSHPARAAGVSIRRKACERRRRMRLRSWASPIFLVIVKPKRGPESGSPLPRGLPSNRKEGPDQRVPPRSRRNSARRRIVTRRALYCRGGLSALIAAALEVVEVVMTVRRVGARPHTPKIQREAWRPKPTDACGLWRGGGPTHCVRQRWTCDDGSHGGACARSCSAGRCVSRQVLHGVRPATHACHVSKGCGEILI